MMRRSRMFALAITIPCSVRSLASRVVPVVGRGAAGANYHRRSLVTVSGRRRRPRSSDDGGAPRVKRVLQRSTDGLPPEVARVYPEKYGQQLEEKVATLRNLLADATGLPGPEDLPPTEVFESEREGFRMRAAFATWRDGDEVHYVMFNKDDDTRMPRSVPAYPMGSARINELMPIVRAAVEEEEALNEKINDIRFLTTLRGDALVALTYNRPIDADDRWEEAATRLAARLPPSSSSSSSVVGRGASEEGGEAEESLPVKIVGRSRKTKIVVNGETVQETLTVRDLSDEGGGEVVRQLHYTQTEGAFSQPNARVCEQMLSWACDVAKGFTQGTTTTPTTTTTTHSSSSSSSGSGSGSGDAAATMDLCELYCGNGCFTVALAPYFRRVVATELSRASVELAQRNIAANGLEGRVLVAKLSAEEFVEAFRGTREFTRLRGTPIAAYLEELRPTRPPEEGASDTEKVETKTEAEVGTAVDGAGAGGGAGGSLNALFVDPPRAGLDETCRDLARGFDHVLYVSCNPETLARDVADLHATHAVTRLAAFDQFPYTPHLEAGVLLQRRT